MTSAVRRTGFDRSRLDKVSEKASPDRRPARQGSSSPRMSAAAFRRWAIAAAVKRPCLKAFVLPTGAPGDAPLCIRQRPFVIAGDRHDIPLLVRAPHRGLRCMGNLLCTGLFLRFRLNPPSPGGCRNIAV